MDHQQKFSLGGAGVTVYTMAEDRSIITGVEMDGELVDGEAFDAVERQYFRYIDGEESALIPVSKREES